MEKKIIIFDTTLRDGEQALPATLCARDKLQIALALEEMGVDVIEAGFPVSSPGDFQSVSLIAKQLQHSKICSLARCVAKDIDVAAEAMQSADSGRIHLFLGTSELHVHSKLKRTFIEIMEMAVFSIKRARNYTDDVEFSCEDAGRTDIEHLCQIVEAAIHAGATTINIPDTVGYTYPSQLQKIIRTLSARVPNIHKAILSVHCHNDLGMAVGNSISAIESGARQIEGSMNGLGERAGNTALEELIMALQIHGRTLGVSCDIRTKKIFPTCRLISRLCRIPIAAHKAVIGKNAFAHSSGIHQDGVLKNRSNYEIMNPKSIGLPEVPMRLTARSGRAAIQHRMQSMGYSDKTYDIEKLYVAFVKLADQKGTIYDYDLEALAFLDTVIEKKEYYRLKELQVISKLSGWSTATVAISLDTSVVRKTITTQKGPIDAVYQAIQTAILYPIRLEKLHLFSQGIGKNTLGKAEIMVLYKNRAFYGQSESIDFIEAFAKSLILVMNHIWKNDQISIKTEDQQSS